MQYFCFCELGGEQERDWAAVAAIQCRLDREGGTKLFTDLVMSTKNDKIFQESIQLAICLLEGGNTEIQVTDTRRFFAHFSHCCEITEPSLF